MLPVIFVMMVLRMLFMRCGAAKCLKKFGGRNHASGISFAVQFVEFRDLWIGIAERFAYVACSIWHNRNATRMKTTCIPYNKIYGDMLDRFKEYQSAQQS